MPRNGRPPSEEPRTIRLYARLSEEENDFLEAYAISHKLSKTQVVVKGLNRLREDEQSTSS